MSNIHITAVRGGHDILNNLSLLFDDKLLKIPIDYSFTKQYNIRFIFEILDGELSYPEKILGTKLIDQIVGKVQINDTSVKRIQNNDSSFQENISLSFSDKFYFVGIKVYEDNPISSSGVLGVIPIPTDMLNIYIYFSSYKITALHSKNYIEKHFDSYSHLGFFLVDIPKMEQIIFNKYGRRELDLVEEFSNSTIIDELFEEEIIMIIWGINPFTYPIYSAENIELLNSFLGREFPQEGVFNIREDIKELSIIPGHELRNFPQFLSKEWKKISLKGKGKTTHLKPFCLEDQDKETIITSFLVYRSEDIIEAAQPLINVDLLYS